MTVQLIVGHWAGRFEQWMTGIERQAVISSPYLSSGPVAELVRTLQKREVAVRVQLDVLTDLSPVNVLRRSTDPAALALLMDAVPHTQVYHLPNLHAKVYVADEREAIVTSGNLTNRGLHVNFEYGLRVTDRGTVRRIRADLLEYAALGGRVSRTELERLIRTAQELRDLSRRIEREARRALLDEFERRMGDAASELMEIRATGQTTTGIFAATILYLLRRDGPLRTVELHPRIQQLHPDLCDDSIDRVIKGVHFGKKWKHHVRNAQQYLKRRGLIGYDGERWHLSRPPSGRQAARNVE